MCVSLWEVDLWVLSMWNRTCGSGLGVPMHGMWTCGSYLHACPYVGRVWICGSYTVMCPYVECGLVFLYVCSYICGTGTCGSCVCVPMRNVDLWVLMCVPMRNMDLWV